MPDLIVTEALGSAIQQHEDDIERYRLLIAQRAQQPRAARPTADRIRWERRLTTEAHA